VSVFYRHRLPPLTTYDKVSSELMTLTVLYFAKARELAGTGEERVEFAANPPTLRALMTHLAALHPPLSGSLERMRVALNESFAELDELTSAGDVIALIPPVAGG